MPELEARSPLANSSATYAGLSAPGDTPELLFPQLLEAGRIEHSAVFSPDLKTALVTVSDDQFASFVVMEMRQSDGRWSSPRPASFSGAFSDHGVMYSPSGDTLLLASTRPVPDGSDQGTWQLWQLAAQEDVWGEPRRIHIPGSEGLWQSHASLSGAEAGDPRRLYFHMLAAATSAQEQPASFDIYRAEGDGEVFGAAERLGPEINTEGAEVTAFVAADESFLLFAAYDRPDGYGEGDLYVSFKDSRGEWSVARNLGPEINSAAEESNPTLSPDGRYLIFSSTRPIPAADGMSTPVEAHSGLHLYWVRSEAIQRLRL